MSPEQLRRGLVGVAIIILIATLLYGYAWFVPTRRVESGLGEVSPPAHIADMETSAAEPASVAAAPVGAAPSLDHTAVQPSPSISVPTNAEIDSWLEQQEDKRLEAEGFSAGRIAWIRGRAKELRAQWAPGPGTPQKYRLDKDLDLRFEIGDAEYERYRRALDRPVGIPVAEVLPGSAAQGAGLLPGDQIVGFGGKRVFNIGELDELLPAGTPGEAVMVEVRREGSTIHVSMPRGALGIRTGDPTVYRMNLIEARDAEAGHLPPVPTMTPRRLPYPRPAMPWRTSPEPHARAE